MLSTITYRYLVDQIKPVAQNPLALSEKVQHLVSRILSEMSLEEIEKLQHVVQSQRETDLSSGLTQAIIKEIFAQVNRHKPIQMLMDEAVGCVLREQLDGAIDLLNKIKQVGAYRAEIEKWVNEVIRQYELKGEYDKIEKVQRDFFELKKEGVTPQEKVTIELGKSLLDRSLDGLEEMLKISALRLDDPSLQNENFPSLRKKLAEAEKRLDQERVNFKRACTIRSSQEVIKKALLQKQDAIKQVLYLKSALLKSALHKAGLVQTTYSDHEAQLKLVEAARQASFKLFKTLLYSSHVQPDEKDLSAPSTEEDSLSPPSVSDEEE